MVKRQKKTTDSDTNSAEQGIIAGLKRNRIILIPLLLIVLLAIGVLIFRFAIPQAQPSYEEMDYVTPLAENLGAVEFFKTTFYDELDADHKTTAFNYGDPIIVKWTYDFGENVKSEYRYQLILPGTEKPVREGVVHPAESGQNTFTLSNSKNMLDPGKYVFRIVTPVTYDVIVQKTLAVSEYMSEDASSSTSSNTSEKDG